MQLPTPDILGLPEKYDTWRPYQSQACELMIDPDPRFFLCVAPTGFGKSLTYMTAAHMIPGRAVILTSTKGLQSQLLKDFPDHVVDIRGRNNYTCRLNTKVTCDLGLCMFGVKCTMKTEGGCFYYDQVKRARSAKVVVTNYSYWMSQNEYAEGLGNFDMLVSDEAHAAPDHVIDHMSVVFSRSNHIEKNMLELKGKLPTTVGAWITWAGKRLGKVNAEKVQAKLKRKEKRYLMLKRLHEKLERLADSINKSWVWEDNGDRITLSPIWCAPYTETTLFLGIPKVVLTSATVVGKTASLLGVPKDQIFKEEFPHSFPVENRPLIHIPTVRMNHRNTKMDERLWITKLDQIVRPRVGTKGIIHTVSYKRRDLVLDQSTLSKVMITHQRRNTEQVVRTFKRKDPPCVLVSPTMATGWDFPGDQCRWQVIVKLPYPDTRGAIIQARSKEDKDYSAYIVAQQLVQATGRGVRSVDDWCETFIIDGSIVWFLDRNRHLIVDWFNGSYRESRTVPKPIQMED